MRIDPNKVTTPKEARAFTLAKAVMADVDMIVSKVDRFDQSSEDFNKQEGSILLGTVTHDEGHGDLPRLLMRDANLQRRQDGLEFEAKAEFVGWKGLRLVGTEAKVQKIDSTKETTYVKEFTSRDVDGPNTRVVKVNKETGEWNVQRRWLGIIPARI